MFADAARTAIQEPATAPVVDGGFWNLQQFRRLIDGEHGRKLQSPMGFTPNGLQFLIRQRGELGMSLARHVGISRVGWS